MEELRTVTFLNDMVSVDIPVSASIEEFPNTEELKAFIGIRDGDFKAVVMPTDLWLNEKEVDVKERLKGYAYLYRLEWKGVDEEHFWYRKDKDSKQGMFEIVGIPNANGMYRKCRFRLCVFYVNGEETFFSISYPDDRKAEYEDLANRMCNSLKVNNN